MGFYTHFIIMVSNFYSYVIIAYAYYVLCLMLKLLSYWYYVDLLYKNKVVKSLRGHLNPVLR